MGTSCPGGGSGRLPHVLAGLFMAYWAVLAVAPFDRAVWFAENVPVVGVALLLAVTFRRFRFSNPAYGLMAVWLFLHTLGGHYTFERVPFDWVSGLFGFERNHFDRIAHFSIGFYAFPVAEFVGRRGHTTSQPVTLLFSLFAIMSLAATYELIEWWYAVLVGGDAGAAFLGSQGDPWDAQKDMLMDTLGALCVLTVYALRSRHEPDRPEL